MKFQKLLQILIVSVSVTTAGSACQKPVSPGPEPQTLSIGLYSYVPDQNRFETAIRENWAKVHPDVELEFRPWNGYYQEPEETLDLFAFDAVFLTTFISEGFLLPLDEEAVKEKDDLIPFAFEAAHSDGTLYAVPQLLCSNLLYTRKDDTELAEVKDIETLYSILGDRKNTSRIPEDGEGLLIDMYGNIDKSDMYLDALMDEKQTYSDFKTLPDTALLSQEALNSLRMLARMGGREHVMYETENELPFIRAKWFAEGKGRAFIGYSEGMAVMGDAAKDMIIRPFSHSSKENFPLFTVDMVSINAGIPEEKKELAMDLLNVMTGEDTLVKASLPSGEQTTPQYFFPARFSVYRRLEQEYPIYSVLEQIASNPKNRVLLIGSDVNVFFANMSKRFPELIFEEITETN